MPERRLSGLNTHLSAGQMNEYETNEIIVDCGTVINDSTRVRERMELTGYRQISL